MFTIRQAAREHLWQEAVEALASLLSTLPRDGQVHLAIAMIVYAKEDLEKRFPGPPGRAPVFHASFPLPNTLSEKKDETVPPWTVHLLDARDDLLELLEISADQSDDEFAAKIALITWECVLAIQVKTWAQNEPEDYQDWQSDNDCKGVFESLPAQRAGEKTWSHVDDTVRELVGTFSRNDAEVFQMRPSVSTMRSLIGMDAGDLASELQPQSGMP